ncbi:MAG: glutamate-cysteine ligase family protein [Candidatus Thermoplasmatota archaeon]|nr:glutamate-cysteine ligase family protein [Candidatus Thermoplasmatota archaeon]
MFSFSHGVEQEFQIVDDNGKLVPAFDSIAKYLPDSYTRPNAKGFRYIWQDDYKTQLEISTGVCWTYDRLKYWLTQLRAVAFEAAEAAGYKLIAAGCNPRGDINPQEFFSEQHHVGISNGVSCNFLNFIRNDIYNLISYSANSPFHDSQETAFRSYRMANAVAIGPISGLPYLSKPCTAEQLRALVRKDPRQLDATLISDWNTVEVRLFDNQPSIKMTLSTAVLMQAIASRAARESAPFIDQETIAKNRRLAIRFGMSAKFGGLSAQQSLTQFVESLEDDIEEMGFSKEELSQWDVARRGKSFSDWQLNVYREGGMERLCKHLIRYTKAGRGALG